MNDDEDDEYGSTERVAHRVIIDLTRKVERSGEIVIFVKKKFLAMRYKYIHIYIHINICIYIYIFIYIYRRAQTRINMYISERTGVPGSIPRHCSRHSRR